MKEAKFKIGDRVITECGPGNIEVVYTRNNHHYAYGVCLDDTLASCLFFEDELIPERKDYSMDIKIDIANNVVVATLYESVGGCADTHPQGTWSSDPRGRDWYCPGRKLCLLSTVQEHGRE